MKVVVLDLSRAGTSSLQQAYSDLGIIYHCISIMNETPLDSWNQTRVLVEAKMNYIQSLSEQRILFNLHTEMSH